MAHFYVTEERAMAPGVSGDWPPVIPKPDNPNGRLKRVDGLEQLIRDVRDFVGTNRDHQQAFKLYERLRDVVST